MRSSTWTRPGPSARAKSWRDHLFFFTAARHAIFSATPRAPSATGGPALVNGIVLSHWGAHEVAGGVSGRWSLLLSREGRVASTDTEPPARRSVLSLRARRARVSADVELAAKRKSKMRNPAATPGATDGGGALTIVKEPANDDGPVVETGRALVNVANPVRPWLLYFAARGELSTGYAVRRRREFADALRGREAEGIRASSGTRTTSRTSPRPPFASRPRARDGADASAAALPRGRQLRLQGIDLEPSRPQRLARLRQLSLERQNTPRTLDGLRGGLRRSETFRNRVAARLRRLSRDAVRGRRGLEGGFFSPSPGLGARVSEARESPPKRHASAGPHAALSAGCHTSVSAPASPASRALASASASAKRRTSVSASTGPNRAPSEREACQQAERSSGSLGSRSSRRGRERTSSSSASSRRVRVSAATGADSRARSGVAASSRSGGDASSRAGTDSVAVPARPATQLANTGISAAGRHAGRPSRHTRSSPSSTPHRNCARTTRSGRHAGRRRRPRRTTRCRRRPPPRAPRARASPGTRPSRP